jgi:DNA-binding SARP family transcriptional activator
VESTLRVFLFGNVHLRAGEAAVLEFPTRKAKALFGFLVLSPNRLFTRETLAGSFWPEASEERARRSLHTELWRIRRTFKQGDLDPERFLISRGESVGFDHASPHWSDVRAFDAGIRALSGAHPADSQTLTKLADVVALYRGDLLDGIYDDWCLVRREALRAQLLSALDFLMHQHIARHEWKRALDHGQRLIAQEPLLEEVHRAVMRCHYFAGNRPAALRHYAACASLLRRELGIEPMEETRRLYASMISGNAAADPPDAAAGARTAPGDPNAVLAEVSLALSNLHTAQRWLEDASRQLKYQRPSGAR